MKTLIAAAAITLFSASAIAQTAPAAGGIAGASFTTAIAIAAPIVLAAALTVAVEENDTPASPQPTTPSTTP